MSLLMTFKMVIVLSVVLSALALAMRARGEDILYLVRRPALAVRSFISMYVVVPIIAVLAVALIDPRPGVALALLVLSLSPVPPLLPKKQLKSGGEGAYILALLIAAAAVSIVVMPLGVKLLGELFGHELHVSTAAIAKTLAVTVVGPMLLGLVAQRLLGARAELLSKIIGRIGMLMLVIGSIGALVILAPAVWRAMGEGTLVAMLVVIVAGLAAGYLLGGPSPGTRTALALASATRHPGVALGVIGSTVPDAKLALVAVLVFVLLNVVVGIPFVMAAGRRSGG
ncbi:hypothetical protein [Stenotrophomonas sp. PS02289]|uniref:hypothetical protein n=1 Tax=Stenotrophomonas sp. PS02289 TaxID=2991422 RepID=UPI00249B2570|nr:hypothetical protein [Stenotrophomonas sp. PS02289]